MSKVKAIRAIGSNVFDAAVFLARVATLFWVCYATLMTALVWTVLNDVVATGKHFSTDGISLEELAAFPGAMMHLSAFAAVLVHACFFILAGRSLTPLPVAWQRKVDHALDAFGAYINPRAARMAQAIWQKVTAPLSRIEWWYKGRLVARALKQNGFVELKPGMELPAKTPKP